MELEVELGQPAGAVTQTETVHTNHPVRRGENLAHCNINIVTINIVNINIVNINNINQKSESIPLS